MRMIAVCLAGCMMLSAAVCLPLEAHAPQKKTSLEGIWLGTFKPDSKTELRFAFHVVEKDGKYSAKLDSIDQGVKGLTVDEASLDGSVVRFVIKAASLAFEGKLNKEGTEIAGDLKQGKADLPMTLKRVDKLPVVITPARPQEPKRPFPYREEEVTFENKVGKAKLAGTLTLPKGSGGPFAAVLLITGSGLQNRDEEILGHKPFLLIADYLTRRGIAVLRVDDRGMGGSTGDVVNATTADFVEDVRAGVEFLKSRKDIDATQIGLIGHSEGGIIAPVLASQSKDIAFIVMLAGSGVPGEDILMDQNKLLAEAKGASKLTVDVQLKLLALTMRIAKKEADPKVASNLILEEFAKLKEKANEAEKKELTMRENADLKILIKMMTAPWMRYFITFDPRPALRKVKCPVLALIGNKDLQVPSKVNLENIEKCLKEGGNKDFTCKELPNLNHLFQTCTIGGLEEYSKIEETFSPAALDFMGDWILKRVRK